MNAVSRWDLPSIHGESVQTRRPGKTVVELEEVERRAYEEGYAKGQDAGMADGQAAAEAQMQPLREELDRRLATVEQMLHSLAGPLQELDDQVEDQLAHLALIVGRHLLRRELRIEPAQVIAIIRETVGMLPAAARDVRVHLHPEDAAVVREKLANPSGERAWTMVEDPVMTRGGCRVTTDTAQIDARLETRINTVVSTLLGEERARSSTPATDGQP